MYIFSIIQGNYQAGPFTQDSSLIPSQENSQIKNNINGSLKILIFIRNHFRHNRFVTLSLRADLVFVINLLQREPAHNINLEPD